jgi:hypothetical protein
MDNLGGINTGGQRPNEPIPFDDGGAKAKSVSHAPLDLGGASQTPAPQSIAPKPVARPSGPPVAVAAKPVAVRPAAPAVPAGRIQGVKTFFTKLHPGAISFLDEQITRWLTENPNIVVKQTNVAVGEVEAKKTEANIIITVWF